MISIGHFLFAVLGAILGLGLSRVLRQCLRWRFSHTDIADKFSDYQMW